MTEKKNGDEPKVHAQSTLLSQEEAKALTPAVAHLLDEMDRTDADNFMRMGIQQLSKTLGNYGAAAQITREDDRLIMTGEHGDVTDDGIRNLKLDVILKLLDASISQLPKYDHQRNDITQVLRDQVLNAFPNRSENELSDFPKDDVTRWKNKVRSSKDPIPPTGKTSRYPYVRTRNSSQRE